MHIIASMMVRRWDASQRFWQRIRGLAMRRDEAAAVKSAKWKQRLISLGEAMRGRA